MSEFGIKLEALRRRHHDLTSRRNRTAPNWYNGVFERYELPVLTADHAPLEWRFDLNPKTNPFLLERLGINAVLNPGAMKFKDKYVLMVRVEGVDRKSFFAVAESDNGIDNFRFRDEPVVLPELGGDETNVYDMRLVSHQDGWIYGFFCVERKAPGTPVGDESSAVAAAGIARTRDLVKWERLPDLRSPSQQQRNVVVHPEFVNGRYMLYTRPLKDFLSLGGGPGIGYAFCDDLVNPLVDEEFVFDPRNYHTIKEGKNGLGPAPIKTPEGWLHLCHGVRECAAGMRYVLYALLADLDEPGKVIRRPGGYLMAPKGDERVGDVSNVLFANGWIADDDGRVFLYYASSDTRAHVATTTVERLLDYVKNTPPDAMRTAACVSQRLELIRANRRL